MKLNVLLKEYEREENRGVGLGRGGEGAGGWPAEARLRSGARLTRPGEAGGVEEGAGDKASTATFQDAARNVDLVILAVKGAGAEAVIDACGSSLEGKTVIDTTNPIAETKAPVHGVLSFFTTLDESLMERLQKKAPYAKFVKCFSCVGNALMVNPKLKNGPPSMFICGNDAAAKGQVKEILDKFGWEIEDLGKAQAARAIEPLCILWCIPGLNGGGWMHAYKVLRP
jgi:predicted dinucleotide-binding enzyme